MAPSLIPPEGKGIAFIDLGTNSIRLLVVRLNGNGSYTVERKEKEFIRLGEGEFRTGRLQPQAMERAVVVAGRFRDLALSYGVDEIVAVATAATRDAENRVAFLDRLRDEAGLDVRVVSGKEEARLIYLGVAGGTRIDEGEAFFIDIGGGSTEIIAGDGDCYDYLDSLKVGAIRLTNLFFDDGETGPVSDGRYALLTQYVRNAALRSLQRLKGRPFGRTLGSSGTLLNLVEMSHRRTGSSRLSLEELQCLRRHLCGLDLKERRSQPGINPERADIIVAGAAIVETIMAELALPPLEPSPFGLQEGLLLDHLHRALPELVRGLSVRERSVLQLCRSCHFDEPHARHVQSLALELFDGARCLGLHDLGDEERDLLRHVALMHDLGLFLSFSNHHAHSHYIVSNAELLGFDEREIAVMAVTAFYHRKKLPKKKHPPFAALDGPSRKTVRHLSLFLRLAESLDRSHAAAVRSVDLALADDGTVRLLLDCRQDCRLELWQLEEHRAGFKALLKRPFRVEPSLKGKAAGDNPEVA